MMHLFAAAFLILPRLARFSELFTSASLTAFNQKFDEEELVSLFNQTCQTVLDSVASYSDKKIQDCTPGLAK